MFTLSSLLGTFHPADEAPDPTPSRKPGLSALSAEWQQADLSTRQAILDEMRAYRGQVYQKPKVYQKRKE